jgi:hypothetical protein
MVSPGWRATRSATCPVIRACISANDSPFGNLKAEGWRCTVDHAFSFMRSFRRRPVQEPNSHSMSPEEVRTRLPTARAIGAAVSRVRSIGEE